MNVEWMGLCSRCDVHVCGVCGSTGRACWRAQAMTDFLEHVTIGATPSRVSRIHRCLLQQGSQMQTQSPSHSPYSTLLPD